jgi:hypothetical protein
LRETLRETLLSVVRLRHARTHDMSRSMYSGAETEMGRLTLTPSAHMYSYLGPAHITGQVSAVQNSATVP